MYSSQFNLTRMFLNSFVTCCLGLVILFHLLVNCLRVDWIDCLYVCRVCFDCASHQRCTVGIYCASSASEWPCFQRKKGFFSIFFQKKWTPAIKKIKKQFSSALTSAWRQLSYVSSTSPDNWRQSLTTKLKRRTCSFTELGMMGGRSYQSYSCRMHE